MIIGILGDVHGDFLAVGGIMKNNPDIGYWLCTGDLADDNLAYFSPPSPLYWISGNHENWEKIKEIDQGLLKIPNLFHIKNAHTARIDGVSVLGLGGNYSPNYYHFKKSQLPKGRERHYTEEEIHKCMRNKNIDILITHEAPSPYYKNNKDAGRAEISEIVRATTPKIHFFCHHHKFSIHEVAKGIKSICLGRPKESWIKLDCEDFNFEYIPTSRIAHEPACEFASKEDKDTLKFNNH